MMPLSELKSRLEIQTQLMYDLAKNAKDPIVDSVSSGVLREDELVYFGRYICLMAMVSSSITGGKMAEFSKLDPYELNDRSRRLMARLYGSDHSTVDNEIAQIKERLTPYLALSDMRFEMMNTN